MNGQKSIFNFLAVAILVSGCASTLPDKPGYSRGVFSSQYSWEAGRPHPSFPHIKSAAKEGFWLPDPGYSFISSGSLAVRWTPGASHPTQRNIYAHTVEGMWVPDDGYAFRGKELSSVAWTPNQLHGKFQNIYSSTLEGYWISFPGYKFVGDGTLVVRWTPGLPHPSWPKVMSSRSERYWQTEPGYRFFYGKQVFAEYATANMAVEWVPPGTRHPHCPYLVSAAQIENWVPVNGYRFVSRESLAVIQVQPGDTRAQDFLFALGIAALAHQYTRPAPDAGILGYVGAVGAKVVRDQAANSAIEVLTRPNTPRVPSAPIPCDYWGLNSQR